MNVSNSLIFIGWLKINVSFNECGAILYMYRVKNHFKVIPILLQYSRIVRCLYDSGYEEKNLFVVYENPCLTAPMPYTVTKEIKLSAACNYFNFKR